MRVLTGLILLLGVAVAPVRAAVIEIPLPGLHGHYPISETIRTVTFQLPQVPNVIHGASFRIVGTTAVGLLDCGTPGALDKWPMDFIASMNDTPVDLWLAWEQLSYNSGEFTWTAAFEPYPGNTTWGFLLDGEGDISLFGAPAATIGCDELIVPTGNVTEAVLIIDVEFPNPVEASTWGRIKALYR